jgi:hypothetical protein
MPEAARHHVLVAPIAGVGKLVQVDDRLRRHSSEDRIDAPTGESGAASGYEHAGGILTARMRG